MPRALNEDLFLPELLEPKPGRWEKFECDIRDAAVDLYNRKARVPKPHTEAQRQARIHEAGHAKYSPRDFKQAVAASMNYVLMNGEIARPDAVLLIARMLEENRIDWLLWSKHRQDIRGCREALDWELMKPPEGNILRALGWVLQLAWTVWGSRGMGKLPNQPPPREPKPEVVAFFDACWQILADHPDDLQTALVRGCLRMYEQPTNDTRNRVTAALAAFFPPEEVEPDEELPPPTKEEKEAQEEAEEKEQEKEREKEEEESGQGGDPTSDGTILIHDHTASIRRPSMKIARRETPVGWGIKLTFPHRYMLDKSVFAHRSLTEGGIMIDGSGSMKWDQEDMEAVLKRMPAVVIGMYNGFGFFRPGSGSELGKICILAKKGRFSVYRGKETDYHGGNDIDLEALEMLATWPKPRFWLSDGYVCGGKHTGPHPHKPYNEYPETASNGKLIDLVNKLMKRAEILRVPDVETMHRLLRRERVTLYRSCIESSPAITQKVFGRVLEHSEFYPPELRMEPVSYFL